MEKQNRAERRRNKFGGGRATAHGGWPTVKPNPVFVDPETAVEREAPAKASAKSPADATTPEAPEAPTS
jgi:hypothetical protein